MTEELHLHLSVAAFVIFALLASGIVAGGLYAFGVDDEGLPPQWAKRVWDVRFCRWIARIFVFLAAGVYFWFGLLAVSFAAARRVLTEPRDTAGMHQPAQANTVVCLGHDNASEGKRSLATRSYGLRWGFVFLLLFVGGFLVMFSNLVFARTAAETFGLLFSGIAMMVTGGFVYMKKLVGPTADQSPTVSAFAGLTAKQINVLADGLRALQPAEHDEALKTDLLAQLDVAQGKR